MIANLLAYSSKNHFRVDVPPLNSSKELQNLHPCWWLLCPQCPKVKPCLLPPRRLVSANDSLRWACSSASRPGSGDDLYLVSMSWFRSVGLGGCWGGLKGVLFPFSFFTLMLVMRWLGHGVWLFWYPFYSIESICSELVLDCKWFT